MNRPQILRLAQGFLCAYPVALPAAFLLAWSAGRFTLGWWPRPSLDDPKDIGLAVDIACWIAALLLILGLPTFVATAGTLAVDAILPGNRSLRRLLLVVAATVAMVGAVLVIRADPFGITSWFFD